MDKRPDIKRKSPVPYIIVFVLGMWLIYGDKSALFKPQPDVQKTKTAVSKKVAKSIEKLIPGGKFDTDDTEKNEAFAEVSSDKALARKNKKTEKSANSENTENTAHAKNAYTETSQSKKANTASAAATDNEPPFVTDSETNADTGTDSFGNSAAETQTTTENAGKKRTSLSKKLFLGTMGFIKKANTTVKELFWGTTGSTNEAALNESKPFYSEKDGYIMPFSPDFNAAMNAVDEPGISVVLIVDVSGSMNLPPEAGGERKYIQAARAVESIATYIEELQFGSSAATDSINARDSENALTPENTPDSENALNPKTATPVTQSSALDAQNTVPEPQSASVNFDTATAKGELLINVAVLTFDNTVTELMPLTRMDKAGCAVFKTLAQNPQNFTPNGNTAVGAALQKGSEILAASGTILNTMLLVTDGKNNFAPQPVDVLQAIYANRNSAYTAARPVRTDTQLVSIIGFDVQDPAFDTYRAIGSRVVTASDQKELQEALKNLLQADITKLE